MVFQLLILYTKYLIFGDIMTIFQNHNQTLPINFNGRQNISRRDQN